MGMSYQVVHNEQEHSFEVVVEGYKAHLDYRMLDDGTLDLFHTFVPPELRGKGLAAVVTEAALKYAQEQGCTVRPSCSYVAVYLQRKGSSGHQKTE